MILYLGLDPSRFPHQENLLHYPVIRTQKIESAALKQARKLWPIFTHVIFTSRTAVRYWFEEKLIFDKQAIAIGDATSALLREKGVQPLIAEEATQEGVIRLLETIESASLFWPRSKLARPLLMESFPNIFALDLYETVTQKIKPVPSLDGIQEIVFTSPSTVHAFLGIFGFFPKDVTLTAIGPVTKNAMRSIGDFYETNELSTSRASL